MDALETIREHLEQSAALKRCTVTHCGGAIAAAARLIAASFRAGGKLLLCGNGGSAADCQHLAAEFVSRLRAEVERPSLPAIALTTDTSFLTAFTNDCGYDGVFARQVEGLGRVGDVLLGISTSGGSRNVLAAVARARRQGLLVIALTGRGGPLGGIADVAIQVPSDDTQLIQECHLAVEHLLCDLCEQELFALIPTARGAGRGAERAHDHQ